MPALETHRLPGQCEVCRRWAGGRLCADCLGRFAPQRPRCTRCALPLDGGARVCGECLRDPPPFEHTACVADYGFPWDRLIADFKFRGSVELAGALAASLADAVAALPAPDLVLPVPLSARRLAERGYNQAWELARRLRRPARADVLQRPIDSAHQADLSRAGRLANLRAAFVVDARRRRLLAGRRVALVDDVFTTGATARCAAAALRHAGAGAVDVWVLARTA
jgi:ComF family protein